MGSLCMLEQADKLPRWCRRAQRLARWRSKMDRGSPPHRTSYLSKPLEFPCPKSLGLRYKQIIRCVWLSACVTACVRTCVYLCFKCVCLFFSDWLCVQESPGQHTLKGVYVLIRPRKVQRSEVSESKSSSTLCSIKCHIRGNLASLVGRCQATNTEPTCLQNVVAECTAQSDSPELHGEMHLSTNTLQIARVSEQLNITTCQLEWLSQIDSKNYVKNISWHHLGRILGLARSFWKGMTNSTFLGKALCASWIKGPYLEAAKRLIGLIRCRGEQCWKPIGNTIETQQLCKLHGELRSNTIPAMLRALQNLIFVANDRMISISGCWLLVNVSRNYGKYRVPHPHQTSKTKGLFLDKIPKNLCFWLALPKALFSWVDAI